VDYNARMATKVPSDIEAACKAGKLLPEMNFMQRCWALTSRIPAGKVMTYGELASAAGSPQAARAAGQAMASNPYAPGIPCHRVVASTGDLRGYSGEGGAARKEQLLKKEGVPITPSGRVKREAFLEADELVK